MVGWYIAAMAVFLAVQRGAELYIANRNRQWSMGQGAVEIGSRHYPLFFLLHGAWFAGWITEGVMYSEVSAYWQFWLGMFAAAQFLRYWCIASLGRQWNTRIIVVPGLHAVRTGPYRIVQHPNYLAVAVELICVPLLFGALYTAILATALNAGLLITVRIPAEEKALKVLR